MPIVSKEALFRKLQSLEPWLVPAIVMLVGAGAFGLGRLSAVPGHQALRILYPDAQAASPADTAATTAAVGNATQSQSRQTEAAGQGAPLDSAQGKGVYVASKTGTKYYLSSCSAAGRIKDANKVYFASADEAKAAGYAPAANCQGL